MNNADVAWMLMSTALVLLMTPALAFFYGLLVLPESLPKDKRMAFSWRRANPFGSLRLLRSHPELSGLAVVNFLLYFAHHVFSAVFVLYAAARYGWGPLEVGALLAMVGGLDMIVQGLLTVVAVLVGSLLPDAHIAALTATGGLLLVGVGLRLLRVREIPVGDLLPALLVALVLTQRAGRRARPDGGHGTVHAAWGVWVGWCVLWWALLFLVVTYA